MLTCIKKYRGKCSKEERDTCQIVKVVQEQGVIKVDEWCGRTCVGSTRPLVCLIACDEGRGM